MLINIMTWNTALTDSISNGKEPGNIEYIKGFIDNNANGLAILQEIPYKDANNNWNVHKTFGRIRNEMPDEQGYKFFHNLNYNNGRIVMFTTIITKIKDVDPSEELVYPLGTPKNRESAVSIKVDKDRQLTVLGIHAQNGRDTRGYLKALDNIKRKPQIIAGDFNAGDYYCENRDTFQSILSDYVNICNLPTRKDPDSQRLTCIDHIFVDRSIVTKCSDLIIHTDINSDRIYSDHFPITFKLEY